MDKYEEDGVNMEFIVLAGLPASGKSSLAKELAKEKNAYFTSLDNIREELFGNPFEISEDVLGIAIKRIQEHLSNGENVVFEATNKTVKVRTNLINQIKKFNCEKKLIVCVEFPEVLIERNNKRANPVKDIVILEMLKQWQSPSFEEGWNSIDIVTTGNICVNHFLESTKDINQNNPYHVETLGNHCKKMGEAVKDNYLLKIAAYIHDIGKIYTTFTNDKGYNSFWCHENAGAYLSLMLNLPIQELLYVSNIICYHGRPYSWSNKEKTKLTRKFGDKFIKELEYLNELDKIYA